MLATRAVTPAGRIGGPTIGDEVTLRDSVVIPPLLAYSPAIMSGFGPLPNLKRLSRHDHSSDAVPFLPARRDVPPLVRNGANLGSGATLHRRRS